MLHTLLKEAKLNTVPTSSEKHDPSAPDVSIVIVNWNTRELLRNCLESVYQNTRRVRLEVVVVDNASSDGSAEMVSRDFPQVILIRNGSNLGFAKANNVGFRRCSGRLILLLNSDTLVNDAAIDASVEFMAQHPETGVLGCRIVYPDGTFQSSYFKFERLSDLFLTQCLALRPIVLAGRKLGLRRLNFPSRYWGAEFSRAVPVDVVAGCFFLVRQEVIAQVGSLDEDFFFYGEEEEWCFRIKRSGWPVIYFPNASIVHIHGASSKKALFSANLGSRRARLLVFEKTRGSSVAWVANGIMLAGSLLRMPVWFLLILLGRLGLSKNRNSSQYVDLLKFHLTGLWRPAWRPSRSEVPLAAQTSNAL